ncbi:hypothetical protein [Fibrobacter sp.]|uniref:hypothetical protein n=1 Tax=Fibrobacter sp. TaxID=35828 RepID=UPI003863C60E
MVYCYAVIYIDKRTGAVGSSPELYCSWPPEDQVKLINWYESRHKYASVSAIVERTELED